MESMSSLSKIYAHLYIFVENLVGEYLALMHTGEISSTKGALREYSKRIYWADGSSPR